MIVAIYGAININSDGIGVPVIVRSPCKLSAKPKMRAAATAPSGAPATEDKGSKCDEALSSCHLLAK